MIPIATTDMGMDNLLLIMAGITIAIVVPYLSRRIRMMRSVKEAPPIREQWNERKEETEVRRSADRILVQLVDTSREITGQADTRIRMLNALIREADETIARLEALHASRPPRAEEDIPRLAVPEREESRTVRQAPPPAPDTARAETRPVSIPPATERHSAAPRPKAPAPAKTAAPIPERTQAPRHTPSPDHAPTPVKSVPDTALKVPPVPIEWQEEDLVPPDAAVLHMSEETAELRPGEIAALEAPAGDIPEHPAAAETVRSHTLPEGLHETSPNAPHPAPRGFTPAPAGTVEREIGDAVAHEEMAREESSLDAPSDAFAHQGFHGDGWQQQTQERVAELHRKGYTVPEIARMLGLPRQEVSLILGLLG